MMDIVSIITSERVIKTERELWQYLKTTSKPIVLYGMGNGADKIIYALESFGITFEGVFASDGFVRNKLFHGHKISTYNELKQKFGDMIVLLCFGSSRLEVIENVLKISAEQELYAPEVPVISGGLFTSEFYSKNKSDFDFVYNRLADEQSKKTFESLIKYKISGKIEYLLSCEVSEDEPYKSFLGLGKNESFLDLGAYRGDTVVDFIKRQGQYQSIIAVEPDKKNFKKLVESVKGLSNIKTLNVGIGEFCEIKGFGMRSGRNSSTEGANTRIEFLSVDKIAETERISFIKADIEGQEIEALKGAHNTIKNLKPKMQIACYHKTDDLITIPKQVFTARDDYKLYIRHFRSLPAWDTNFYFC